MYASTTNSFYRSTNTGENWTLITSGLPSGESRIAIGVTPNNSTYVYLLCGPGGSPGAAEVKATSHQPDGTPSILNPLLV